MNVETEIGGVKIDVENLTNPPTESRGKKNTNMLKVDSSSDSGSKKSGLGSVLSGLFSRKKPVEPIKEESSDSEEESDDEDEDSSLKELEQKVEAFSEMNS